MDKIKPTITITVTGENVHNVGYRYFLLTSAIDLGLAGFNARNTMKGNELQLVALIEGHEEAIADFKKLAERQRPEHSSVTSIVFEDTDSAVMRTGEYAQVCTTVQFNKAIPQLLDFRDDMKEMKSDMKAVRKNTDTIPQTPEEIKAIREDIQPGYAAQIQLVQAHIPAIKERWGMSI